MSMQTIERLESEVRSYCRSFPAVFSRAEGHTLVDEDGREYLDFFAGAGVLNYGHNPPALRQALTDYLADGGLVHSLDMATAAKARFLERFDEVILQQRGLSYKIQFPGPTGTNAVEAALKLARKVTGRTNVGTFTNGFHGMTLGALAVTGNARKRKGAGVPLGHASVSPYDGYFGDGVDTVEHLQTLLEDSSSGVDLPAAVILETVQAEGGVNVASFEWLKRLAALLKRHGILLIVDDIQVGCGRTGPFFSFEPAGIQPDIVCLSKSISGFGLPMALVLLKPEHDIWSPGEHNGTFRGHNLAFVTAAKALDFWQDDFLTKEVERKGQIIHDHLEALSERFLQVKAEVRGRGMIRGIAFEDPELAGRISTEAFKRGLVIETAGAKDEVLKFLPPLTISDEALSQGLDIVAQSLDLLLSTESADSSTQVA